MTDPSYEPGSTEPAGPDLRGYVDLLLKWKWLILAATVVVVASVAVWTFTRTRVYRASAAILVSKATPEVLGGKVREVVDLSRESYWDSEEYLQNQLAVACSTAVAQRVAKSLALHQSPRFWGVPGPERRRATATIEQAAGMLLARASCSARRKTTIIDISLEHPDSELAAELANALAQAYIDQNLDYKLSSTLGASEWLSKQLDDLRQQLEASEKSLYEFKQQNNLMAMPLSGQQNLLTRQIERLSDELSGARVRRMALGTQLEELRAIDTTDPLTIPAGSLLDSTAMDQLKMTYVEERRKHIALRERYLDRHPLVVEQRTRMLAAGEDVRREVHNRVAGLAALHQQALRQEHQLASALGQARKEALELNRTEQAYLRLKRPVDTTSQLYDVLLARMKESSISGQLRLNNMHVLEPAVASFAPVRPRVKLNLLVGLLLGLLLGVGLAFLIEALDTSVKSEEEVTRATGMVCLGAIPSIKSHLKDGGKVHPVLARSPALIVHHRPMSVPAECWRAVRTNLLFSSPDRPVKSIVVTSAGPQEGKTSTAVGLATAMAQSGKPVLLIDADMRQPRLHTIFDLGKGEGVTAALRGDVEVDELIRSTEVPNLYVLPCGQLPPNPAELCGSERLFQLVQRLGQRFDRVFIDSPPAMMVTDPVLLAARFDAAVLVIRTGKTTRKVVQDTFRQITEVGGHLLGCVLNDMDVSQRGYRYYPYRARAYRVTGAEAYAARSEDERG